MVFLGPLFEGDVETIEIGNHINAVDRLARVTVRIVVAVTNRPSGEAVRPSCQFRGIGSHLRRRRSVPRVTARSTAPNADRIVEQDAYHDAKTTESCG